MENKNKGKLGARCENFDGQPLRFRREFQNQTAELTNTAWVPRGDKKRIEDTRVKKGYISHRGGNNKY